MYTDDDKSVSPVARIPTYVCTLYIERTFPSHPQLLHIKFNRTLAARARTYHGHQ